MPPSLVEQTNANHLWMSMCSCATSCWGHWWWGCEFLDGGGCQLCCGWGWTASSGYGVYWACPLVGSHEGPGNLSWSQWTIQIWMARIHWCCIWVPWTQIGMVHTSTCLTMFVSSRNWWGTISWLFCHLNQFPWRVVIASLLNHLLSHLLWLRRPIHHIVGYTGSDDKMTLSVMNAFWWAGVHLSFSEIDCRACLYAPLRAFHPFLGISICRFLIRSMRGAVIQA